MLPLRAFALASVVVLALGCGGRSFEVVVDGGGGDDGGGSSETGTDGMGQEEDVVDSGSVRDVVIPMDEGVEAAPPVCPIAATVQAGGKCLTPNLICSSAAPIYTCGGGSVVGYVKCTCAMGQWVCPPPGCVDAMAPPPSCPAPTTVHAGSSCLYPWPQCDGDPTTCGGAQTFYDVLSCKGTQTSMGFAGTWQIVVGTNCNDH
jgi:hypothetical protein